MREHNLLPKRSFLFLTWLLSNLLGLLALGLGGWLLLGKYPELYDLNGSDGRWNWALLGGGLLLWLLGLVPAAQGLFQLRLRRKQLESQYIALRKADAELKNSQMSLSKSEDQCKNVQQLLDAETQQRKVFLGWLDQAIGADHASQLLARTWQLMGKSLPDACFSFWELSENKQTFLWVESHPSAGELAMRKISLPADAFGEGQRMLDQRTPIVYLNGQEGGSLPDALSEHVGNQPACVVAVRLTGALAGLLIGQHDSKVFWTESHKQALQEGAALCALYLEKAAAHRRVVQLWDDRNHLLNMANALPQPLVKIKLSSPILLNGEPQEWEMILAEAQLAWHNEDFDLITYPWQRTLQSLDLTLLETTPNLKRLSPTKAQLRYNPIVMPDVYKGVLDGFWIIWENANNQSLSPEMEQVLAETLGQLNVELTQKHRETELFKEALRQTTPLVAILNDIKEVEYLSPAASALLPWRMGQSLLQELPRQQKIFDISCHSPEGQLVRLKATLKILENAAGVFYLLRMTRIG